MHEGLGSRAKSRIGSQIGIVGLPNQGNAEAQCCLGDCYRLGDGVEQDYSAAFKWYPVIMLNREIRTLNINLGLLCVKKVLRSGAECRIGSRLVS